MSEPLVRRSDRTGVAIIELDRPRRKNAIIAPMLDELGEQIAAYPPGAAGRLKAATLELAHLAADTTSSQWFERAAATSTPAATIPPPIQAPS